MIFKISLSNISVKELHTLRHLLDTEVQISCREVKLVRIATIQVTTQATKTLTFKMLLFEAQMLLVLITGTPVNIKK